MTCRRHSAAVWAALAVGVLSSVAAGAVSGAAGRPVRVAAVLPAAVNNLSWVQALHDGLRRLKAEAMIDYVVVEHVEPANVERVLRRLAEREYDLILAHSATYKDAVFRVAA